MPSIRSFLESYFQIWNGRDNRDQVLRLLQYLPVEPYQSLRNKLLLPLESAILDETIDSRQALLDFYSALISQWGVQLRTQSSSEESVPLTNVVKHAELLASSIQEFAPESDSNQTTQTLGILSVLRFYRCLADLFTHASQNASIRLTVPLAATVYTIAFSPCISIISTLNTILADYKLSFETSLASQVIQPPNAPEPLYDTNLVNRFNGYVMDICNLVWRNRALNAEDPNALGCLIPETSVTALTNHVRNVNEAARHYDRESAFHVTLSSVFSLSHHAAFCNLSAACFAELEEEQQITDNQLRLRKPVTQKALQALEKDGGAKYTWQKYRVHMLDWLDEVGSRGTGNLMRSTMKALRQE